MSVITQTFDGFPLGSNLAVNPDEIPNGFARYLQDIFCDNIGQCRQRGPVQSVFQGSTGRRPIGVTGTYSVDGTYRLLLAELSATGFVFTVVDPSAWTTTFAYGPVLAGYVSSITDSWVFDSKPALGGGVLIGMTKRDGARREPDGTNSIADILFLWKGAGKTDYNTGTLTAVLSNTTLVGVGTSWTANVDPGMFVFDKTTATSGDGLGRFIGVVKSVTDNTHLELESGAANGVAGITYAITPFRRVNTVHNRKVSRGFITVASGATGVTGSDTTFQGDALTSAYGVYRASDGFYIGQTSTVSGQRGLTLGAGALASMDNQEYQAWDTSAGGSQYMLSVSSWPYETAKTGFLNAQWQGQQWYANRPGVSPKGKPLHSRLWVNQGGGDILDGICYDEASGSFFDIDSTQSVGPIKALIPTESMLLVMKEEDTFAISGTDIDSYQADRILADGALSAMAVQPYLNGCVWAGKRGIYQFDGRKITNLTLGSLGDAYTQLAQSMDLSTYRAYSMLDRDHYFVHMEKVTVPVGNGITRGSTETGTGSQPITICVNLKTKAVSFMTNLGIRGSHKLPASLGGSSVYVMERLNSGSQQSAICKASDLFLDTTTADSIAFRQWDASTSLPGPDFYIESPRFTMGDEERKKLWKMIMLWHWNEGGTLTMDVIKGLGNDYTTSSTLLTATTIVNGTGFINQRIKFLKRHQYLGFRIYKTNSGQTTVTGQSFSESAGTDDGETFATGGTYPPTFSSGTSGNQNDTVAKEQVGGPTFTIRNALHRWDTSSLPDSAIVTQAQVKVWLTGKADNDNRNIVIDWYAGTNWPIDVTDGANMTSGTAATIDLTTFTNGALNTVTLSSPDTVSKTGYTGIRWGVDGGSPSSTNNIQIAAQDNISGNPKPVLVLNYTYNPTTTTRVKLGAWSLGFKFQRPGRP